MYSTNEVNLVSQRFFIYETIQTIIKRLDAIEKQLFLQSLENEKNVEISLNFDFEEPKSLLIKSGCTAVINLNNQIIKPTKENIDAFIIEDNGILELKGRGIVETKSKGNGFPIVAFGKVKIYDGTYISREDANGNANACIYAKGNGNIEIYGGHFESLDGNYVLNIKDSDRSTAKITVYGGEFVDFDPSNNASEGKGTNFVADGYDVNMKIDNDGRKIYTVFKK